MAGYRLDRRPFAALPRVNGPHLDSQNERLWNGKTVSGPSAQTLGYTLRSSALLPDEGIGLWRNQPRDQTPKDATPDDVPL
jgi:hypothetical protein